MHIRTHMFKNNTRVLLDNFEGRENQAFGSCIVRCVLPSLVSGSINCAPTVFYTYRQMLMAAKSKGRKAKRLTLADMIRDAVDSGGVFYSFEYSAARDPVPEDLYSRIERMKELRPTWIDVTWGFRNVGQKSIDAVRYVQKELKMPVLMHLICTEMTRTSLDVALETARLAGVRNILALRGYTQAGFSKWQKSEDGDGTEPQYASELVEYIKNKYGDHFCIGVAAFPEGHPESDGDLEKDIYYLKKKVDAGAEFIICQFCFSSAAFNAFLGRARLAGITVPILPGIMPITSYSSAKLLSHTWAVQFPPAIETKLKAHSLNGDVDAARKCGHNFIVDLCKELLTCRRAEMENKDDGVSNQPNPRRKRGKTKGKGGKQKNIVAEGKGLHFFVYDSEYEVRALLRDLV